MSKDQFPCLAIRWVSFVFQCLFPASLLYPSDMILYFFIPIISVFKSKYPKKIDKL